jgi:hypothetical protein
MQLLIAATEDYPGGDGGQARPFRSGGTGDPPGRAEPPCGRRRARQFGKNASRRAGFRIYSPLVATGGQHQMAEQRSRARR